MKNEVKSVWICGSFTFNLIVYWYLKTSIIMANFELRFFCSSTKEDWIRIDKGLNNDLVLVTSHDESIRLIIMDKSTAIKFAKTLRTEINKITESEVFNG